jgi:hypothetical protein
MIFAEALAAVFKDNDCITRREWRNRELYGCLEDDKLYIRLADGLLHPWIISESDFFADDWEIITEA